MARLQQTDVMLCWRTSSISSCKLIDLGSKRNLINSCLICRADWTCLLQHIATFTRAAKAANRAHSHDRTSHQKLETIGCSSLHKAFTHAWVPLSLPALQPDKCVLHTAMDALVNTRQLTF
eukprot:1839069-Amphidinium_carterae.1